MSNHLESHQIIDSYLAQLEATMVINFKDTLLGRKQSDEMLNVAAETTSQICNNLSSLSAVEKVNVRKSLQDKITDLDSNILSNLSKFTSKEEIPSFVYFVLGSIIALCFTEIFKIPFSVVSIVSLGLILGLMFLTFSNNKKRYLYEYLLKLLNR